MTGVLKTVGGSDDGMQVQSGIHGIYSHNDFYILCFNCYFDGADWRYSDDGVAMYLELRRDLIQTRFNAFQSGIKDAVLIPDNNKIGAVLTDKTGLPLTGGVLNGDIMVSKISPLFLAQNTATARRATLESSGDSWTKIWNWKDGSNYQVLSMSPENEPLNSALYLHRTVEGNGSAFRIYGEHNIIVSASPPGQLSDGQQYQVY